MLTCSLDGSKSKNSFSRSSNAFAILFSTAATRAATTRDSLRLKRVPGGSAMPQNPQVVRRRLATMRSQTRVPDRFVFCVNGADDGVVYAFRGAE